MDTKLKNYRKLTCIIIGIIILLPSLAMMVLSPHYIRQQQEQDTFPYSYRDISRFLVEATYVLHAEEVRSESNTSLTPYEIFLRLFRQNLPLSKRNLKRNLIKSLLIQKILSAKRMLPE